MQSYSEYQDIYPSTLELIEDFYCDLRIPEKKIDQEDKCRIVATMIRDLGVREIEIGDKEDNINAWLEHFIRAGDPLSTDIFRRTLTDSVYNHYRQKIIEMFQAVNDKREAELLEGEAEFIHTHPISKATT